ncbi:MAG: hypothetical protein Q8M40_09495, partial [Legionella sp.]|nr:hypothetical protein [Legionella sp.]
FNVQSRIELKGEINTTGSSVIRIGEDGHRSSFTYNAQKQGYIPQNGGTECLTYRQNEWIYQTGGQKTSSHYNTKGQLTFLSDLDGHAYHFTYIDDQLTTISSNSGKQQVTWSFKKGLLQDVITTSEGTTIHHLHYEYDGQNRLHHVNRDLGEGKIYWITYDYAGDSNRITDIKQSDGTKLHIDYDMQGRVKKLIDGAGRETSYAYEAGKTTVTDGFGESWTYYYDDKNRLTGIDGPNKYRIRYQYEGAYLKSITQGNQVWNFRYNKQGDCIFIEEPDGKITQRFYDLAHHVIAETHYQSFDENHNPMQPQTARYIYDEKGHLRFSIAADGTITERRYDTEGQLLNTRCYLRNTYDLMTIDEEKLPTVEQLQTWIAQQNPQDISLVSYQYDWRGQLIEEIHYAEVDASGQGVLEKKSLRTRYSYDAAGRLIEKSTPGELGWSSTYYFYDDLGRLTQSIDNHQNTQRFEYDDTHQRIIQTDANGLQTIRIYDGSGLLLSIIKVDATHNYGTIYYTYDQAGRLITETGVDGLTAYTFYDAQGRIKAKVNAQGLVTEFQYNDEGQVVRTCQYEQVISTASWDKHPPSYDSVKPSATTQDRISQTVYNQYNQLAYKIDSIGAIIAYRYDANGQMISSTAYANKLSDFNPKHVLTFNEVKIKDDSKDRTNSYYYDSMGRLQGEINGEGYAVAYTYDRLGNLIESCRYF